MKGRCGWNKQMINISMHLDDESRKNDIAEAPRKTKNMYSISQLESTL